MAGLVEGLKRGHRSLTIKVDILEQKIEKLKSENRELVLENRNLIHQFENLKRKQTPKTESIFNHFIDQYFSNYQNIMPIKEDE